MTNIVEILGAFGDDKPHYKEEVFEVIRYAEEKKHWSITYINNEVKKYVEYGLITRLPDSNIKGYFKWKITEKGIQALDHYRNSAGYLDLSKGVLF